MRDGAERDRSITDELTRFLRDDPDARVVDDQTAAPEDPRRKAERRTDLLLACLMVVVALGLLHFVTPWGETDTISILVDGFEDGGSRKRGTGDQMDMLEASLRQAV